MERLAIICAHPVQYYAPLFQLIAKKHIVKVFYQPKANGIRRDKGFNMAFEWDLPLLEGYDYEFSHQIKRIRVYKPSAVLIYGWAFLSHIKLMLYFHKRIPVFFRGDSTLLDKKPGWILVLRNLWLKFIYQKIDYACYVGSQNKAYFKRFGLSETQLIYMPHTIDNNRFSADRTDEAIHIRTAFGIKAEDILILFTGKLIKKKGPELLLAAFARLNKTNIHLLFVGSGVLEPALKRTAQTCINSSNIHFMPFQNQLQMPAIYQSCELFCFPSIGPGETWGLAINEAMAANKAVLASDAAGAAYDLVNKYNGATFKNNNIDDLHEKLKTLTSQKHRLKQMGLQSHHSIQNFSFQHQINALYGV
jgi:glycosyltransferase involved in cell wall biosynthesis